MPNVLYFSVLIFLLSIPQSQQQCKLTDCNCFLGFGGIADLLYSVDENLNVTLLTSISHWNFSTRGVARNYITGGYFVGGKKGPNADKISIVTFLPKYKEENGNLYWDTTNPINPVDVFTLTGVEGITTTGIESYFAKDLDLILICSRSSDPYQLALLFAPRAIPGRLMFTLLDLASPKEVLKFNYLNIPASSAGRRRVEALAWLGESGSWIIYDVMTGLMEFSSPTSEEQRIEPKPWVNSTRLDGWNSSYVCDALLVQKNESTTLKALISLSALPNSTAASNGPFKSFFNVLASDIRNDSRKSESVAFDDRRQLPVTLWFMESFCLVPLPATNTGEPQQSNNSLNSQEILIASTVVPSAVVLLLVVVIILLVKRRSAELNNIQPQSEMANLLDSEYLTDIVKQEKIGSGNFGDVFRGTWLGTNAVALKCLKNKELLSEFMDEASVLKKLNHTNIVRFLGIYKDLQDQPYLVTEYMSKGSLRDFLLMEGKTLEVTKLAKFALDAAAGMNYLEKRNIIHRDLAVRNLLVDDALAVKVGDFGLSRAIPSSDYYKMSSGTPLAIKWTAPEALQYEKFSPYTDRWSFGIVLWEIFELGKVPYIGKTNEETVKWVLDGNRLAQPALCPESIYKLMLDCWSAEPSERPSFEECHNSLAKFIGISVSHEAAPQQAQSNDEYDSAYMLVTTESSENIP